MVKVFYTGHGFYRRLYSNRIGTPNTEWLHGENFSLFDHDVETLNQIGGVSLKAVWDIDLENTIIVFTDKDGNPAPFEIVKGQDIYRQENGNALRLYFDDAPLDDIKPTEKTSLLNKPAKQDDWFEVISLMTNQFYAVHGAIPTQVQAWNTLSTQPPAGYAITTAKDTNRKDCLNMAGKTLGRSVFNQKWKRYTK